MAVDHRDDVFRVLRSQETRLRALGVRRIGLFGSFARDEQTPTSDVDLLVDFAPGEKSFARFMELSFFLEEVLGRPVELVTPEGLSPYLGSRILAEAVYDPVVA